MNITKSAKRLMACTLMFALVAMGLVIAPNTSKAASDDAPAVKVLGATLRLADNGESQALRIGIEISNASKAANCGITLKRSDGKSASIQTGSDEGAANKIYDYDKETDKLIYTAVVTGITPENFGTGFEVTGKVQPLSEEEWTTAESTEAKSIDSVVTALNKQMGANYYFDGSTLIEKVVTYDFEGDLTGNAGAASGAPWFSFSQYFEHPEWVNCNSVKAIEDGYDGSSQALEVDAKASYGGLPFPKLTSKGQYILSCYAKKAADDETGATIRFKSAYGTDCKERLVLTDDWQQLKSTYTLNDLEIVDQHGNTETTIMISPSAAGKYVVDNVEFCKVITNDDLPKMEVAKDFSVSLSEGNLASNANISDTSDKDDVFSATLSKAQGGGGLIFYLNPDHKPILPSNYSKVKITLSADVAKAPLCVSLRNKADTTNYWGNNSGNLILGYPDAADQAGEDKVIEYDISTKNSSYAYGILIKYNPGTEDSIKLTIKSIEFIA